MKKKDNSITTKPWEFNKSGKVSDLDPFTVQFVESVSYDYRMYKEDIFGSIAHARMLLQVGLVTKDEFKNIDEGLTEIKVEIDEAGKNWSGWKTELEDVHMCIEAALIEKKGDAGRKLHTGRSRNDQVVLDQLLWITHAVEDLSTVFMSLFKAFINLAERDGEIVMPSYTHLQRAQPIVVGGEIMAWMEAFKRCEMRMKALKELNNYNPLGAGAIAGSILPLDRNISSEFLNIHSTTKNSIDSTGSRDIIVDFLYSLTMIAMTLSRWAEQWIIYSTTEFNFIKIDELFTTGSSMMPQKKNPDMLELIRGRCGNTYGSLMAMLTNLKGLCIGYNRDFQEDKRIMFSAFDRVKNCMIMANKVIGGTEFCKSQIEASLDKGFLDATTLAEYLVLKGLPFRTAHQIVGRIVEYCNVHRIDSFVQLTLDQFNLFNTQADIDDKIITGDVYDYIGAKNVVKLYKTDGNAGFTGFKIQLEEWKKNIKI